MYTLSLLTLGPRRKPSTKNLSPIPISARQEAETLHVQYRSPAQISLCFSVQMLLFQPDKKPKPGQLGEAVRRRKFFAQQLEARPRSTVRKQAPPVPEPKVEEQKSPILLQQSPLITPTEPGGLISRYCIVYYWIEELLSKAAREGLIDTSRPEALWKMQENITKMRGAAADVFMYLYCKVRPPLTPPCP